MTLSMGKREMELPSKYLGELREANEILSVVEALRGRMEEEGYLLIRGLFERVRVLEARRQLVEVLAREDALDPDHPPMEAVVAPGPGTRSRVSGFRGGDNDLTRAPAFRSLVESQAIMGFFQRFLGGEPLTYEYKWLRIVGPGSNTGAHYDVVYMGRGTHNVYTCWTPLGDVPYELGPLALLVGSHRFERVRETYGRMDVDRDHVTGWFSNDPIGLVDTFGGQWRTAEFRAGDALIFGMFTMHASLNNTSNRFRLSSDTRYQLKDEPVDERWIGRRPKGHYAWTKGATVTMEEARAKWGV